MTSEQPTASNPGNLKSPLYAQDTDGPFLTRCPECEAIISTEIDYKFGPFTFIACVMIASFGFFLGCCAVPFCMKSAKDIVHVCPECKGEVGRKSKF